MSRTILSEGVYIMTLTEVRPLKRVSQKGSVFMLPMQFTDEFDSTHMFWLKSTDDYTAKALAHFAQDFIGDKFACDVTIAKESGIHWNKIRPHFRSPEQIKEMEVLNG